MKIFMKFCLLGIVVLLASCDDTGRAGGRSLKDSILLYKDSMRKTHNRISALEKTRDSLIFQNNYWFDDIISEDVKQLGIPNPDSFVVADLLNRQELVPEQGILGGTMRFTNVKLLGDRWAIAEMDDGHIMGYVLLKYQVLPGKKLRWSIIDYYID